MNTFFTADHHFGHENIIKFCKRPFSSVEEMDNILIDNWNKVVNPEDTVYHLGDFTFADTDKFSKYASRLLGKIYIIPGNHDWRWIRQFRDPLYSASDRSIKLCSPIMYLYGKSYPRGGLTLCHYSMRTWRNSYHGSWHLYGHSHGTLPSYGKSLDVGVDAQGYTPISVDEVRAFMESISENVP